jgi:hypothetical protein
MAQLDNVVLLFVEYLLEDGQKQPKHVEGLLCNCKLLYFNFCAVVRILIVKLNVVFYSILFCEICTPLQELNLLFPSYNLNS